MSEPLFPSRVIRICWSDYHHRQYIALGGARWLAAQVDATLPIEDRFMPEQVRKDRNEKICNMLRAGYLHRDIAHKFGVSISTVSRIGATAGVPSRNRKA